MIDTCKVPLLLLVVEFVLPDSISLKVKRSTIKSITARIRQRFNVSVSEIGYQDKWQRGVIGISMIGSDRKVLEKTVAAIELLLRDYPEIELCDIHREWL